MKKVAFTTHVFYEAKHDNPTKTRCKSHFLLIAKWHETYKPISFLNNGVKHAKNKDVTYTPKTYMKQISFYQK